MRAMLPRLSRKLESDPTLADCTKLTPAQIEVKSKQQPWTIILLVYVGSIVDLIGLTSINDKRSRDRYNADLRFAIVRLYTDRIRTEKCLYDLYKPYGSSKRSPVAQVMRCNCQTVYGPKIVFTIRKDREAVFSDRISLSNRTDGLCFF